MDACTVWLIIVDIAQYSFIEVGRTIIVNANCNHILELKGHENLLWKRHISSSVR